VAGTYVVTYDSTDCNGNAADQVTRTVTVQDTIAPVITLVGADPQIIECSAAYSELGATATDTCCGDLTAAIVIDASAVDTSTVGSYTVTYDVTDCNGNPATQVTRTVNVVDTTPPVISGCPTDITQDNDPGVCSAVVTWTPPTASDSCDPSPGLTSTHASGATFPVGTTTVTYTATDACGNTSTPPCEFTVTVTDVEPPTTVFTSTPSNPDNNATPYFEWSATDNNGCTAPGNLVYSNRLDGGLWSAWSLPGVNYITLAGLTEGTHTFEVRAKDEVGNIETTASYTWVLDLTLPVIEITVPAAAPPESDGEYVLNDTVNSDWTAVDLLSGLDTATADDDVNAGMVSGEPFYTGSVGLHDFTVTATDLAGNTATETVEYRVVYTVNPGGAAGGGGGVEGEGGTFLDKSIAGGGGAVGITTLEAVYTVGDMIHASFSLTDGDGEIITDAVTTLTLVEVILTGEGETYNVLLPIQAFPYDDETSLYSLDIATEHLVPGIYDLWLGFDDGTQERIRIQLEE